MQDPRPPTTTRPPAGGGRITLQLIGLDKIADVLEVTWAELDDLVAGDDFPTPFIDNAGPAAPPRRLWTDLSIALYQLRRVSTARPVEARP